MIIIILFDRQRRCSGYRRFYSGCIRSTFQRERERVIRRPLASDQILLHLDRRRALTLVSPINEDKYITTIAISGRIGVL